VDLDLTPCDNSKTKKEDVSRTCKGYAMTAYLELKSYLINCELCEESQHCQKHTPEFLQETIDACRMVTKAPAIPAELRQYNQPCPQVKDWVWVGRSQCVATNL